MQRISNKTVEQNHLYWQVEDKLIFITCINDTLDSLEERKINEQSKKIEIKIFKLVHYTNLNNTQQVKTNVEIKLSNDFKTKTKRRRI